MPAPDVGDLPDLPDAPGVLGPPVVDVPGSAVQIAVQTPAPAQPEAPHPDMMQLPPGFPMMMPQPAADGSTPGYPPLMVMPPFASLRADTPKSLGPRKGKVVFGYGLWMDLIIGMTLLES